MGPVLIVEDNQDLRELYSTVLRAHGYDVMEAENGRVALDIIEGPEPQPCLVFLDLMMPVMSGTELLKELAASRRLDTLPVVAMSAGGCAQDAPKARLFIRKPDSALELLTIARQLCGEGSAGS